MAVSNTDPVLQIDRKNGEFLYFGIIGLSFPKRRNCLLEDFLESKIFVN